MSETWFTSDLHFGHANIIEYSYRPFNSVNHMNEMLVANWNEVVGPEDTVIVLGDVAMGRIAETLPLVSRLNGGKFLVPGNHDRVHPVSNHKPERKAEWRQKYHEAGFSVIYEWNEEVFFEIAGQTVRLSHFPYRSIERHGDRYSAYTPDDDGKWLLHGHTHLPGVRTPGTKEIHVGIDAWDYRPVNVKTLAAIIEGES